MKKTLTTFVALFAMAQLSYAQLWTRSTSDTTNIYNLNSGKVGIGTTTPTNTLSLGNGAARKFWIENSATNIVGQALTIAAGGTVTGTSTSNVTGGNLILQSGLGTGTGASTISFQTGTTLTSGTTLQTMSSKMTILGNGNVGIGTASPTNLLTIKKDQDAYTYVETDNRTPHNGTGIGSGFLMSENGAQRAAVRYERNGTAQLSILTAFGPIAFQTGPEVATVSTKMVVANSGNIGIGTTNPTQGKLVVSSNRVVGGDGPHLALTGYSNSSFWESGEEIGAVDFYNQDAGTSGVAAQMRAIRGDTNGEGGLLTFSTRAVGTGTSSLTEAMRIASNGYVGIGTTTPREALSVNGNIRSKQVKVETANWPDYVFKKDYMLPSLLEIKTYIDKNQRLPDMPSAEEVSKDGLNLGEINKLLTKKVEELTLYLIEQDKQIAQQNTNTAAQEKQIMLLKAQVEEITKVLKKN